MRFTVYWFQIFKPEWFLFPFVIYYLNQRKTKSHWCEFELQSMKFLLVSSVCWWLKEFQSQNFCVVSLHQVFLGDVLRLFSSLPNAQQVFGFEKSKLLNSSLPEKIRKTFQVSLKVNELRWWCMDKTTKKQSNLCGHRTDVDTLQHFGHRLLFWWRRSRRLRLRPLHLWILVCCISKLVYFSKKSRSKSSSFVIQCSDSTWPPSWNTRQPRLDERACSFWWVRVFKMAAI